MSAHTVNAIPLETIKAVAMVGHVVTWKGEQFKLYSVEGYDYYAFISSGVDHAVTIDFAMPESEWKRDTRAFLLPMGCVIGDGYGFEVRLSECRRGVSLTKL